MKRLLFAALFAALSLQAARAQEARLLRYPTVWGDRVVFTYAADLWAADRRGGAARRLTTHEGEERRARISPDGSQIAFVASYDGNVDLYVMPFAGGAPRRLTFDPNGFYGCSGRAVSSPTRSRRRHFRPETVSA